MKNFPNTQNQIQYNKIISGVSNILYAEWNINRYVGSPTTIVDDTIPTSAATEDLQQEVKQIKAKFPIETTLTPGRGNTSAYVIAGTSYKSVPRYLDQRSRSDTSWQNNTTWLWYGDNVRYKYWVSALRANQTGALPYNVGRISHSWAAPKPSNKIRILFQNQHAFPTNWTISIDTTGGGSWHVISTNATVPASGDFVIYRDTANQPQLPGVWSTTPTRWTPTIDNHINCYGVKVTMNTVDVPYGRPGIIELSPRFEADLTGLLTSWDTTEELADRDFIAPIGSASANVGSVTLNNDTGLFNEQDTTGILYEMMDEDVEFRGYTKFGLDTIPMFSMLSDSWNTVDFDTSTVQLVDGARRLQNIECTDSIASDVTAGTALHMMFASLGLKQFNLSETVIKETPSMEKFYTKREDKAWDIITSICKSFQMSAVFDSQGFLQIFTKEASFNSAGVVDYAFNSDDLVEEASDIFSLERSDNSRFNKVVVRYNSINELSRSGGAKQTLWAAPDPWSIGAAQIVKDIIIGQNYFVIDPNALEDLIGFSGKVVIENMTTDYEWEGKQFYCKNAAPGNRYITVTKPSDMASAWERNNGEGVRFTGKVYLKSGTAFTRNFYAKNYQFRQEWDLIEYSVGSSDGVRMVTGIKHSAPDGCLKVDTTYSGGKRFNISKKAKNWNRFDRVGMKFKVTSNDSKTGIVLWPQGRMGASGYYFTVDPMSRREISRIVAAGGKGADSTGRPSPKINGFVIKNNGDRVDMAFDAAKDFRDISPLRTDDWGHLEVAVYSIPGGYDFEVFVNGQYCKTYTDTTVNLTRNEKAGMSFLGSGTTFIDRFYVINYPNDSIKSGDHDESGWVVRRQDLWTDRKASGGDASFNEYLKMVNKKKKTQVFDSDFSGRFYAVAREKRTESVRFEFPAETAKLYISNKSVSVTGFEASAFGAKFTLLNKSERSQALKGPRESHVEGALKPHSAFIHGDSFRIGDPQEIEYKKDSSIDRIGPLPLEFESDWIQDRDTANNLAKWVMDRFGENAETYTVEVFGNPLVEIADIVTVAWPDKGMFDTVKWCVVAISRGWSDGLTTSITIRRII